MSDGYRVLVVNPNTTTAMTAAIGAAARSVSGPDVLVEVTQPIFGPESLESHLDEAMAVPGVLQCVAEGEAGGVDGFVIACFGDPGLLAAREIAHGPVVGIAEAAMHAATFLGGRFSIVTTLDRTVPQIEQLARNYGFERQCGGVHASGVPVVELESDPAARETVLAAARAALAADRSQVLVLGCAGMSEFTRWLSEELRVPVVDGVAAATTIVAGLLRQNLRTAERGEQARPAAKVYHGDPAALATALGAGGHGQALVH